MTTTVESRTRLRAWARGLYASEAAVELLIRAFSGRFADTACPWIGSGDDGWHWLDTDEITDDTIGALSSGERRVLALVASLAGGPRVDLSDALAGLDRDLIELVLAAVAHAAGSHEHANVVIDHARRVAVHHGRLPSLYPWPDPSSDPSSDQPGAGARCRASPHRGTRDLAGRHRAGRRAVHLHRRLRPPPPTRPCRSRLPTARAGANAVPSPVGRCQAGTGQALERLYVVPAEESLTGLTVTDIEQWSLPTTALTTRCDSCVQGAAIRRAAARPLRTPPAQLVTTAARRRPGLAVRPRDGGTSLRQGSRHPLG